MSGLPWACIAVAAGLTLNVWPLLLSAACDLVLAFLFLAECAHTAAT